MILEFAVQNYRSIKEQQIFSWIPDGKKDFPENIGKEGGQSVLKTAIVYGANASGKSNLLKAMFDFAFLVEESSGFKLGDKIDIYDPYRLDKTCFRQPTFFQLNFLLHGIRYEYSVAFDKNIIHSEQLHYFPKGKRARLFSREKNEPVWSWENNEFTWQNAYENQGAKSRVNITYGDHYKGDRKNIEHQLLENQLFLSKAANSNVKQLRDVYLFFRQNLRIFPRLHNRHDQRFAQYFAELLAKEGYERFRNNFSKLISVLDTGIQDVKVEERDEEQYFQGQSVPEPVKQYFREHYRYEINTLHKVFNGVEEAGSTYFELEEESEGTKRLFSLAGILLDALENGLTVIIDEFEKNLHPHIVRFLIQLFHKPEINVNQAQLIFATHDVTLLDKEIFRRDQVWFTEKTNLGNTELFSLSDFEGVRKDVPFDKWYLSGRFGAIPSIDDINLQLDFNVEKET